MNTNINEINEELESELSLLQEESEVVVFENDIDDIDDPYDYIFDYDEEFDKEEADANGKFWEELRKNRENTVVQNTVK